MLALVDVKNSLVRQLNVPQYVQVRYAFVKAFEMKRCVLLFELWFNYD